MKLLHEADSRGAQFEGVTGRSSRRPRVTLCRAFLRGLSPALGASLPRVLPVFALALTLPVSAENRALIIGVGEHEDDNVSDLPGIELDVIMMQDVAKHLGFRASQITTLRDEEATLAAITREIANLGSAGRDDQVLVYFSGHGDHVPDMNGDEEDGWDEVLIPHDTRIAGSKVENVLLDDDLGEMLADIRSRRLLLLIDACHSGTATKSFSNLGVCAVENSAAKNPHL